MPLGVGTASTSDTWSLPRRERRVLHVGADVELRVVVLQADRHRRLAGALDDDVGLRERGPLGRDAVELDGLVLVDRLEAEPVGGHLRRVTAAAVEGRDAVRGRVVGERRIRVALRRLRGRLLGRRRCLPRTRRPSRGERSRQNGACPDDSKRPSCLLRRGSRSPSLQDLDGGDDRRRQHEQNRPLGGRSSRRSGRPDAAPGTSTATRWIAALTATAPTSARRQEGTKLEDGRGRGAAVERVKEGAQRQQRERDRAPVHAR